MKQSPIEGDEAGRKLLADMLFREFEFYRQDSQKTDELVFKLITVLVVPFLLLLGYTLFNPKFSAVVLIVPYVSLIGILILSSVFMRYAINDIYLKYLQKELNDMLGRRIFIGVDLAKMFYTKGFSIVKAGLTAVSFSVLVINLCLIPSIHREIVSEAFRQCFPIPISKTTYWIGVCLLFLYVCIAICLQYTKKCKECEKYIAAIEQELNEREK